MKKDLSGLEKNLGIKFKNLSLLRQAMVHRSFINEHRNFPLNHNERLEFLGDAVLELVVTESLFLKYPNKPEGEMTSLRSSLVNSKKLAEISRALGFEDYLYLSKGESKDTGRAREYILGNTFEAVIGAIYLDKNFKACQKFIDKNLLKEVDHILEYGLHIDPKSHFQEITQEAEGTTPEYRVIKETGPDHDKQFIVGVYLGKKLIAEGKGSSKQNAQVQAAKEAIKSYSK